MEDLQQWKFLYPSMIQVQKCEKCSQDFCSTVNYRRHMRLHRRNFNVVDKDSPTVNRDELQGFWDKLSVEESMEILSFDEFFLEGVALSSVLNDLRELITQSHRLLSENYLKAGIALVELVQGTPSRFPIPSQELFSVLDEASEKTFLCAGLSESVMKYVSDVKAESLRNIVAYTSYFVENRLATICLVYKDDEALKYQKLLEEEEDASKTRQVAILEKKRLKKLRKKEQRGKKQAGVEPDNSPETNREIMEIPHSTTSSCEGRHVVNYHSQTSRGGNDFHNYEARPTHKHVSNGGKVWVPKPKTGITEASRTIIQSQIQDENSPKKDRKRGLLIGSISITLDEKDIHEDRKRELLIGSISVTLDENDIHEKQHKIELVKDNNVVHFACPEDSHSSGCEYCPNAYEEDGHQGYLRCASHDAEAFLAKRWKETIESDHVNLALFHEAETPDVEAVPSSNLDHCSSLLSSTENLLSTLESSGVIQSRIRANLDKDSKVKYIPK